MIGEPSPSHRLAQRRLGRRGLGGGAADRRRLARAESGGGGWLVGFAFWAQILVGSLTLIMIHRLTGGRWGDCSPPVIEPAAATVPLLLLLAIPLFIAIPTLYPWPHQPAAIKPDVLSYYLNMPAFIVRSVAGFDRLVGARGLIAADAMAARASFSPRTAWSSTRSSSPASPSTGICRSKRRSLRRRSAPASPSHHWSARWPGRRCSCRIPTAIPLSATSAGCCSRPYSASPTSISWPCW